MKLPPIVDHLPFRDLWGEHPFRPGPDLGAAVAVTFLAVPQGVAYAMIAGLPPKVGLYAATLPVIVGSLLRSSRHVVSGPTNALSLLVGGAGAALAAELGASPVQIATTLALMVGVFQLTAGLLRLGAIVDYISGPVVLGYITGAAVLIGAGQLHHLTGTQPGSGHLLGTLLGWAEHLGATDPLTLGLGLGTAALVLGLRRLDGRIPGALVAMALGIAASWAFDLHGQGVRTVADLAPIPAGLPPLGLPSLEGMSYMVPVAIAATVLSLVESSAVARTLAAKTGDELDPSLEFSGQGLANIAASLVGAYPVSGSLGRSGLSYASGAQSRLAGAISGLLVVGVVLVAGPMIDLTPLTCLGGLLLVIAWDLIDRPRVRRTASSSLGDRVALGATILGTWTLRLDHAIYLGVLLSIVLFLRRARLLVSRELVVDDRGRLREVPPAADDDDDPDTPPRTCPWLEVVHLEGSLFFGAAGELRSALDEALRDPEVRVLVLRIKRARDLDITSAEVLEGVAARLETTGRHLLLAGMTPVMMDRIQRTGLDKVLGPDKLFPTEPQWFRALDRAIEYALELSGDHQGHEPCAMEEYVQRRAEARTARIVPVRGA